MKRICFLLFLTKLLLLNSSCTNDIPEVEISNAQIKAKIYLPDAKAGYYRATRFDWSGIIPELIYDGHSYFGKWFKNYDPKVHESVMGPVEEFGPIGYKEAKTGDSFIKIGVGALIKPNEPKYSKFKTYEIKNTGEWHINHSLNQVIFKHLLEESEYGYSYQKTVNLPKDTSKLVLHHSLTNTGKQVIATEVYNHNFFYIDNQNIGEGYLVKFPFSINATGKTKGLGEYATIDNKEIKVIKTLGEKGSIYIESITGYDTALKTYQINIENKKTRAGVHITADRPLSRLVFWSSEKTICPEPYINIKIAPGETFTWNITYEFYNL